MNYTKGKIPHNKGKKIRIKLLCNFCKNIFEVFPSSSDAKFCSKKCAGASLVGIKRNSLIGKKISFGLKGRKLSLEHKNKILNNLKRNPMLGKKHSLASRIKMSASHKKISISNWGGFLTKREKLLRNRFGKTIQKQVFERDNYTCQMCNKRGGKLQVDHIQSWAEYVELRFSMENCRTICQACHYFITFGKKIGEKSKNWGSSINRKFLTN